MARRRFFDAGMTPQIGRPGMGGPMAAVGAGNPMGGPMTGPSGAPGRRPQGGPGQGMMPPAPPPPMDPNAMAQPDPMAQFNPTRGPMQPSNMPNMLDTGGGEGQGMPGMDTGESGNHNQALDQLGGGSPMIMLQLLKRMGVV